MLLFLFSLFSPGYVLVSHEFILCRCSRAVLTWAQLVGGSSVLERERERGGEREGRSVHLHSATCETYVL